MALHDPQPLRRAVCTIVYRRGLVLAISRGTNTSDWNVPGGKVDPGEDLADAAARELYEETGVLVQRRHQLEPVYESRVHTHVCTCFWVSGELLFPEIMGSNPFEGYVAWARPEDLLTEKSRFHRYNREAFRAAGIV